MVSGFQGLATDDDDLRQQTNNLYHKSGTA